MIDEQLLDSVSSTELDRMFKEQTEQVFSSTNCLDCGNCCRNYSPIIEDEVLKLSKVLEISSKKLFENYLEMDEEGDFVFKSKPCPMLDLETNRCRIYANRPKACTFVSTY